MATTTNRKRRGGSRDPRRPRWWVWIAVPVLAFATVAAFFSVKARLGADAGPTKLEAIADAPGVIHVHGLGVNPANGDVYAAAHGGLFRITKSGKASRIANRFQDTMGFTIIGPDHFIASGHPDLREDLPPLLGLLDSRDAGRTWTKKSLLGKSDFHSLRFAHDTTFGYDSTGGALMVSSDGRRWETRSKIILRDFVVSPTDADLVFATTPDGLRRSTDGGRSWSQTDSPTQGVLLDWGSADRLWLLDSSGQLNVSADAGATWEARGIVADRPEAFVSTGDVLYVAAGDTISVSEDAGRTWRAYYKEKVVDGRGQ